MATLSPRQAASRGRIEAGLRLAERGPDLILAAGDRVSHAVDREPRSTLRPSGAPARPQHGPGAPTGR